MAEQSTQKTNWRVRSYVVWTAIGTVFGVVSGYFYTRAAEEHAERNDGNPPRVGTTELMGLILAAMAAVRQIAELGKPDKPRK